MFESKKKLRDKDHHTFSYGPNLLLNSQPHIYFTVITSHIHIREKRRKRKENLKRRWRSRCTDRRPAKIEVAERIKPVEIGVHHAALSRLSPHRRSSSSPPLDWIRLACSSFFSFFFFFFFSYLLVLIQLYCKNWILFWVLCLDYVRCFLRVKQRD